ncbi:sodium-dependent nutrient amino acid transporter 1-like [Osmia bicornis bicornis]|uniref:sodium-dependent nutrient amino acid transporter 1-like n=1 Tax=Osmia bicornis bicornis TaxID=1437191 RepID=UPI0010F542FF|nr:sodium-dependent nutrient amino acid transporter 1-like [Osmia bicornis bicornis]XP_029037429.1 sodium-dependent nutrient amino acid transporter 1-like [Osmia bicornis bicornis]XP_029037430.1 sodium-dependent nutrient amino acid transporter 1-like [Osmia bicornis bicornis]XP_029037431.1 sodium-dependent nutrient amino acid transporter 1-like [Osmia bicornis bicornis]XP_029037432.1 sodium-dependent nutrient amino acid transporter 1-like [Osmia bicornis bicornis]XP_029037433.1 sodium-dependen
MEKLENGIYKQNGFTNEAFQMEDIHLEQKENNFSDVEKSLEKPDAQQKVPSENKPARAEWGGGLQFLMACIATSVGLGNVWRFPFTAYENGGGAFLIPYIIILLFVGKPFYFLEGLLGQFTNKSCAKTWNMVPAMKGLGYGQAFAAICVVSYYCALMGLTLYYLVASFQSELPWSYCREEWQGQCVDAVSKDNNVSKSAKLLDNDNGTLRSSAELYFRKIVLNEYDSIEDGIGTPSWQLTICLFLSWMTIFIVLCRGIKSTGKAVYFLAIFPYIVMIALLFRAVTLDGAVDGILFLVTPKWDKLWQPTVWYAAITQCFFSLSVCFGPILTYSSYSNFGHNVTRDVMIVTTLDTFTSLIAGCTIFGILGNLAHEIGTEDISTVVRGGTGLAFISYPEALSRFKLVPQLFAVLFFVMMFVLGVGSAVALCGAVFSILCDHFPKVNHWKLVLMVSVFGFFVSLVYVTPGGQWFITLVDYYGGTFVAIIVGVLEMVTIFWIYGLSNFLNDIEFMLRSRPSFYWRLCWAFITPVSMIIILIYTIATYAPPTYDGLMFPTYAYGIGWFLLSLGVLAILGCILQKLIEKRSSSLIETIKAAFRPDENKWGPSDPKIRLKWKEFIAEKNFQHRGGFVQTFFK